MRTELNSKLELSALEILEIEVLGNRLIMNTVVSCRTRYRDKRRFYELLFEKFGFFVLVNHCLVLILHGELEVMTLDLLVILECKESGKELGERERERDLASKLQSTSSL